MWYSVSRNAAQYAQPRKLPNEKFFKIIERLASTLSPFHVVKSRRDLSMTSHIQLLISLVRQSHKRNG